MKVSDNHTLDLLFVQRVAHFYYFEEKSIKLPLFYIN